MPRITTSQRTRKADTFRNWVQNELKNQHKTEKQLADVIGVHYNTITNRMDEMRFSYLEIVQIFEYLGADNKTIIRLMK